MGKHKGSHPAYVWDVNAAGAPTTIQLARVVAGVTASAWPPETPIIMQLWTLCRINGFHVSLHSTDVPTTAGLICFSTAIYLPSRVLNTSGVRRIRLQNVGGWLSSIN